MSAFGAKIECEENGFHLVLEGEFSIDNDVDGRRAFTDQMNICLDQSAAIELLHSVRATISPWWAEAEAVRADYEHFQSTGILPDYIKEEEG